MIESNIYRALGLMGVHKAKTVSGNVMCQCMLGTHEDKKPSMSIKVNASGVSPVFCFGCSWKGTIVGLAYEMERHFGGNLVREVRSLEYDGAYKPAFRSFKPYDEVSHLKNRSDVADHHLAKREKLNEILEKDFKDCFDSVPKYIIEKRGLNIDILRAWKIGHWQRGRNGVFFPIYDSEKRFVGYTIRWILVREGENSYFHMPGLHKNKVLYGEHMIDKSRSGKYVIVEGPIDALKVWEAGYNALSVLGGTFSEHQSSKIFNLCEGMQGFAMGDGDGGGRILNKEIMDRLSERLPVKIVSLPDGKDPGDLTKEEIKIAIEGSMEDKKI